MAVRRVARVLLILLGLVVAGGAHAQFGNISQAGATPVSKDQPVFWQADTVKYDRDAGLVTLSGHVEFWQNDRILLADQVTYDRNTKIATATGNVVLLDPDGQTMFAQRAELGEGMKDGVMESVRALLAENGKLAANGAQRTDARINELSRMVYSTCDLCKSDPTKAPLWQIRARQAVQDKDNKRIEYTDAEVDIYGFPVMYLPYLTHPDPSEKRASGLLVPSFGYSKHLGAFAAVPYYWVLDPQSDVTLTPIIASKNGPALDANYRRRFNDGSLTVNTSVAHEDGAGIAGHIFTKGLFTIDDTWRWGFDINRASSANYLRDFKVQGYQPVLTSQAYMEGFGQGSWAKLDARYYQGLTSNIVAAKLPVVLPRYQYSFFGQPDALGGRISLDADAFNVLRTEGTNTQRARLSLNWDRPAVGRFGDVWKATLHVDSAAYAASQYNQQPNYASFGSTTAAQAMPTAALEMRWPLQRVGLGSQLIEPIVQVIAAPTGSTYINTRVPNEDSLDFEFTDANLFALNRHPGIDRLEGGMRANVALHMAWTFPSGAVLDGLVGQGYRAQKDLSFPADSGMQGTTSDVVSHLNYSPNRYFDVSTRQRFDKNTFNVKFADVLASAGVDAFRVSTGYIYTTMNPYDYYDNPPPVAPTAPRNEITVGLTTKQGPWRFSGWARGNLETSQMVGLALRGGYEDECFIFDVSFYKRYTSINNDHGSSTILFQITLKTVGQFGFHAL